MDFIVERAIHPAAFTHLGWLPSDRLQISPYTGNLRLHGTIPEAKQKEAVNFNQSTSLQLATETKFLKLNPLVWNENILSEEL